MAGSMEGEVKITPRNSRGWRAVTETLTSIRADNARLRAALKAERMVRNARATPDPGEALIRSFVALVEERDTLRSELDAANAENARLLRLGRVAGELRDCLVDAHFGELWTDGMVDEGYIKPLRIARAEAALAAYDAALKGDPDD